MFFSLQLKLNFALLLRSVAPIKYFSRVFSQKLTKENI